MNFPWKITEGDSPIIATAIHAGHDLRSEVAACMGLDSNQRKREEDPYTDAFITVAPTRVVVNRSRFEVDMNRTPEKAVYLDPADCWGLDVWKSPLPPEVVAESLALHRQFYAEMTSLIQRQIDRFGQVVVLDFHSYNHRRDGAHSPCAAANENPAVNIGTGSMPAYRWDTLLHTFISRLREAKYQGEPLDVRENVRFKGGYFPQWIHATFPHHACAIAIEFKKTFMDEWSGRLNRQALNQLGSAVTTATAALQEALVDRVQSINDPGQVLPEAVPSERPN